MPAPAPSVAEIADADGTTAAVPVAREAAGGGGTSGAGTADAATPGAASAEPPVAGWQPAASPPYPAYPAYPAYAPYGYGQMAPPSAPLAPGQAAPPSVPLVMGGQPVYPAYPPGYGPPSRGFAPPSQGFGPPSQGFAPYPPGYGPYPQPIPDQPRKGRVGLVVGIVAAVLVVCMLLAGGLIALGRVLPASSSATSSHSGGVTPVVATTAATATATPGENVIFQDDFSSPNSGWANDSHCTYGAGGYHIPDGYLCFAPTGDIANGSVTADVKQIGGNTDWYYGIGVRRVSKGNHYGFYITSDGYWTFDKVVNNAPTSLVPGVHSAAIHTGLNAVNTLKVRAVGSHFAFFINGTQVGQFDDSTFTSGLCGVAGSGQGEIVATHFTVALVG